MMLCLGRSWFGIVFTYIIVFSTMTNKYVRMFSRSQLTTVLMFTLPSIIPISPLARREILEL